MNTRRRLALVLVALPLAFYAYACSSDSGGGGTTDDAGAGSEGGPGTDSSTGTDSSPPNMDGSTGTDAADASDGAVTPTCIGNPLTADGGNLDGGVSLDAAVTTQIVTFAPGTFLDGPQWLDANGGFLVFSEFDPTARLERVAADGGALGSFRDAGFNNATNGPVGSALRGGFLITAVDQKTGAAMPGSFFVTAPDGGAAGTLSLGAAGATSPNDLVVGPGNNLYFTDGQYVTGAPGTTGLYQMYPDAAVTKIQQNFGRANGIALSPDNTKLYVGIGPISTAEVDPKAVLVYTVDAATGSVTGPGASFLTALDLTDVPDGIAVDVGGNLWIAEAAANNVASGRIEVFSPSKKKLGTIPFPGHRPTNVAFGGPDGTNLFVTTEASTSGGTSAGVFTYVSRCAGIK